MILTGAFDIGVSGTLAISPDGRLLVYEALGAGGVSQLLSRKLDGFESRALPQTSDAHDPFLSPDGKWVGYYNPDNQGIMKIPLGGGPPTLVVHTDAWCRGANWTADGIFVSPGITCGLARVSGEGGELQTVTVPNCEQREVSHRWPHVLPGGRWVPFTLKRSGLMSLDIAEICLLNVDTGQWQTIISGGSHESYVSTGHIVYARSAALLAVPFDLASGRVRGAPVSVLDGVTMNPTNGMACFAIAGEAQMLAYIPGGALQQSDELVWVDMEGNIVPVGLPARSYANLQFSPDGQRVALTVYAATDTVYVYDLASRSATRVTREGNCAGPIWMADGQRLCFQSDREGVSRGYIAPADGSAPGAPYESVPETRFIQAALWEGQVGMLLARDKEVLFQPLDGDRTPRRIADLPPGSAWYFISPDVRWIAYLYDSDGDVYLQQFPGGDSRWQVSRGGITQTPVIRGIHWSAATRELLYVGRDRYFYSVKLPMDADAGPSASAPMRRDAGEPSKLFKLPAEGALRDLTLHPDGRRFLAVRRLPPAQSGSQIVAVLNWFDELKTKVPTGESP